MDSSAEITADTLRALLDKANYFYVNPDGGLTISAWAGPGVPEVFRFSVKQLESVHPVLPASALAITRYRHQLKNAGELAVQDVRLLRAQLAYLCQPLYISCGSGEHVLASELVGLYWDGTTDVDLGVYACQLYNPSDYLDLHLPYDTPPFVARVQGRTLSVPATWMDGTYPGWRDRYLVASALGYNAAELVGHVCIDAVTPLHTTDLHGVNFD